MNRRYDVRTIANAESILKMSSENQESEAIWGLVEPFDTDRGELEGIPPRECFALGVEWQIFRLRLRMGNPFTTLVLANNAIRLTKLAERSQRFVESRPASDGWAELTVGGYRV